MRRGQSFDAATYAMQCLSPREADRLRGLNQLPHVTGAGASEFREPVGPLRFRRRKDAHRERRGDEPCLTGSLEYLAQSGIRATQELRRRDFVRAGPAWPELDALRQQALADGHFLESRCF